MRLDKIIEENLKTTRKEMKRLFLMKKVLIDDKVEMNPQRNVDSKLHKIQVDGQKLQTNHVYYLLNKPSGVVTAKKRYEVSNGNRISKRVRTSGSSLSGRAIRS